MANENIGKYQKSYFRPCLLQVAPPAISHSSGSATKSCQDCLNRLILAISISEALYFNFTFRLYGMMDWYSKHYLYLVSLDLPNCIDEIENWVNIFTLCIKIYSSTHNCIDCNCLVGSSTIFRKALVFVNFFVAASVNKTPLSKTGNRHG